MIAKWKNIKEISVGSTQIVGLLADGSAVAAGFPEQIGRVDYNTGLALDGSCKVDEWTELKQILALFGETIGLKTNGTLLTTAEMPEEWKQYSDIESIWGVNGRPLPSVQTEPWYTFGKGMTATVRTMSAAGQTWYSLLLEKITPSMLLSSMAT